MFNMDILIIFIFGLCTGSFANVLIYRIPLNLSIFYPNSFCPNCKSHIKWYDNIPLISYFLLKGKCRNCKTKISIQYPIIELLTSIISVVVWINVNKNPVLFAGYFIFIFILLVISVIDYYHNIIPDIFSIFLILTGIFFSTLNSYIGEKIYIRLLNSIIGVISGLFIFYIISFIGRKVFKKDVLGGGDIKLISGIGSYMGIKGVFGSIFFGSLTGSITGLFLIYFLKKKSWGSYLPFGPFLSLGIFIYFLLTI